MTEMSIDMEQEYQLRLPVWKSLREEAVYIIEEALGATPIKVHSIESRVKDLTSFVGKIASDKYKDPIEDIADIVGIRIVTLFKSNLSDIETILAEEFHVVSKDDKTLSENSVLGYRSIHYICTIKNEYTGPRYKNITGVKFEIQVRTICMHAWSSVSHYLDYKGDWDVPKELKESLRALSGLFHIADSQFEQFFMARESYHRQISLRPSNILAVEINLETLSDYLGRKFSNRSAVIKAQISEFINEIRNLGITSISSLDKIIDESAESLEKIEERRRSKFAALGAARVSLGIASQEYRNLKYNGQSQKQAMEVFSVD